MRHYDEMMLTRACRRAYQLVWKRRRRRGRIAVVGGGTIMAMGAIFSCVVAAQAYRYQDHFINQAAETLRQLIGAKAVARLEEYTFDTHMAWRRWLHKGSVREDPAVAASLSIALNGSEPNEQVSALGSTTGPPDSIRPFIAAPKLAGEGQWSSAGKGIWRTRIRADSRDWWQSVELVAMDQTLLELQFVPGMDVTASAPESRIPERGRDRVVAVFNGGFRPAVETEDNRAYDNGVRISGREWSPPVIGHGFVAMPRDRAAIIGQWTWETSKTLAGVDIRQNLHPLLNQGLFKASFLTQRHQDYPTYRSALGVTTDSRWLMYAASNEANPRAMARALRLAGCANAIHLDMNRDGVYFDFVDSAKSDESALVPMEPEFNVFHGAKLFNGSQRDFFFVRQRK